ncbi:MAG TPA: heavy metal-binding domain-containing protein, partial [Arenicellales bacterium]|nr:heavy metal-binding domain-containing protein [Arenicellales bacterium]
MAEQHAHCHHREHAPDDSPAATTDPVCGMSVDPASALSMRHEGETWYFCREGCRDRFAADPQRYLNPPQQPPGTQAGGAGKYICPMCPGVDSDGPDSCPKCGMALEPETPVAPASKTEYVCPMHPEIVREEPGDCPKCGMALEPRTVTLEEEENPELVDMRRRFKVSAALTVPILVIAMGPMLGLPLERLAPPRLLTWLELLLATPVVLWGGAPFFQRFWTSLVNRSLNMFTLIGLGVGVAYGYSLVAALLPGVFPPSFRDAQGEVGVYFEA